MSINKLILFIFSVKTLIMLLKQDSDYIMFLRGCQPRFLRLLRFTVPLGLPLTLAVGSKVSMPGFSDNQSLEVAHR